MMYLQTLHLDGVFLDLNVVAAVVVAVHLR
jgi:hypothetical protein